MNEWEFALRFATKPEGDVLDRLFELGCDDATFGADAGGPYALFHRDAESFPDAVLSAIDAVSLAGLDVVRVEPDDVVSAAEVADRLGRSRESVRLLVAGHRGPGGFPLPLLRAESRNPLWRWADVVAWCETAGIDAPKPLGGAFVAAVNAALELRRALPEVPGDTRRRVRALAR